MVRKGGTVNLFGGCAKGTEVKLDPGALHYSEITIKSTFHHTPRFIREALDTSRAAKFAPAISSPEKPARGAAQRVRAHEAPQRRAENRRHSVMATCVTSRARI